MNQEEDIKINTNIFKADISKILMRKNILNSGELVLDYDPRLKTLDCNPKSKTLVLKRNGNSVGRKYSPAGAYHLARNLINSADNGDYIGNFTITSSALEKIRDYEIQTEKDPFEKITSKTIEVII